MTGKRQSEVGVGSSSSKRQRITVNANDDGPSHLACLLDFTSVSEPSDISTRLEQLAEALLHRHVLLLTNGHQAYEYKILELEFYLRTAGHEDPYTHGSEEQRVSGQWYFHRAPRRSNDSSKSLTSTSGYRGGTRKGLDITIGGPIKSPYFSPINTSGGENGPESPRGGILLRTLQRVKDDKVISGPSLLVDEILQRSGASSISELVSVLWSGDISVFPAATTTALDKHDEPMQTSSQRVFLRLKPLSGSQTYVMPHIYRSPRIGLDLSHPGTKATQEHPRVVFISRPYRYFLHPTLLKANGRPQTFLGVHQSCVLNQSNQKLLDEIVRLTGLTHKVAQKYLSEYESGACSGKIRDFVGPAGKGACSSPTTYLRMMGSLETFKSTDTPLPDSE